MGRLEPLHAIGVLERAASMSAARRADVAGDVRCHEPSPTMTGWGGDEATGVAAAVELDDVGWPVAEAERTKRGSSGSVASGAGSVCRRSEAVDKDEGQADRNWPTGREMG